MEETKRRRFIIRAMIEGEVDVSEEPQPSGFDLTLETLTAPSWKNVQWETTSDTLTITRGDYTWTAVTSTLSQLTPGRQYKISCRIDQSGATTSQSLYIRVNTSTAILVKDNTEKLFTMQEGLTIDFFYSLGEANSGIVKYYDLVIEEV